MTDQRLAEFLKRIPKNAPARVATEIKTAFEIVSTAREKISAIRADNKLSREGQNAAIAEALAKGPLAHMGQLRAGNDRDLESIKAEREGMRRKVTEASEFADGLKREVREWLRELTEQERIGLVHSTRDPLIIESICTAPHFLSKLNEAFQGAFIGRIVEDKNFARLAELAVQEEAFSGSSAAIAVATADMRRESGLAEREFADIAA